MDAAMANNLRAPLLLPIIACVTAGGCVTARNSVYPIPDPDRVGGVIYVVGGAGNSSGLATNLRAVIREEHVPLAVEDFVWTHGAGRYLADQVDYGYSQAQ